MAPLPLLAHLVTRNIPRKQAKGLARLPKVADRW